MLQPCELLLWLGAVHMHARGSPVVVLNIGTGIEEEEIGASAIRQTLGAHVIRRRQRPTRVGAAILDLRRRLARSLVVMIAQDHMPLRHQARARVNILERCLPLRIGDAADAILIEIIADRNDELAAHRNGAVAHLLRHVNLPIMALASPIADDQEIQCRRVAPAPAPTKARAPARHRAKANGASAACRPWRDPRYRCEAAKFKCAKRTAAVQAGGV